MKIKWKVLIVCLAVVYFVAFIGSLFTSTGEWYESIKPTITPPNYVFPIVWNILFFLIALSLYLAWINSKKKQKNKLIIVFGINLLLNVFWSILFFGLQNPLAAFYDLILLWISIVLLVQFTFHINRKASYLLVPYLLWVSFAGILNYLMI